MSNSFDYSHSALANSDSEFTASFIIYLQTVDALQMVDEIAATTQSLRAISQAHLMRRDLLAMTIDLQRYLSYRALQESGDWQEMTEGDNALKYNLAVLTNQSKP